ncbi:extracellular solute-binding protein [Abyssisolibacter fermentans]|uniref:extracellular solute-binding protein n=1 Tax=Abyssisolibacter fermentans TaxID=1766203 RepID=UPI000831D551|nr:extracellular solute-binding protein [Abyssisolibacter fermentans]
MKKKLILFLCIIIGLLTMGCSNNSKDIKTNADDNEITILIKDNDLSKMEMEYRKIYGYTDRFELETGVKVKFDIISGCNEEDYENKINTKLYLNEGPTLIFVSDDSEYQKYIERGIALDTQGKIPNISKIYDSLLTDGHYFIPVSMIHYPVVLNRRVIDKLKIDEPKINWTRKDYLRIRDKWLNLEPEYFCEYDYNELIISMINDLDILDESNKKVDLNNSKVINYINNRRDEIFSGKYIINKYYTYNDFYNMIFEHESLQYKDAIGLKLKNADKSIKKLWVFTNGLSSLLVSKEIITGDVFLPNIIRGDDNLLKICGFIVNRNGKNVELGMEFINGLLSDKIQLEMFKSNRSYPVNKDIEEEIDKIEKEINEKAAKEKKEGIKHYVRKDVNEKAIALRKYIISQVKSGNYKRCNNNKTAIKIKNMIYKDFAKFIFADEAYTDDELSRELQKLENEYNMWLNE